MTSEVHVSIIIVTYNSQNTIRECLDSVTSLSTKGISEEIIVVDGGSTDKTLETVKEYNVKCIRTDGGTIGFCRNLGTNIAEGKYIAFTDSDCRVPSDWLVNLFWELQNSEDDVVAVGGPNITFPEDPDLAKVIESTQKSFLGSGGSPQSYEINNPSFVKSLANCNVMYKRSILKEIRYRDINIGEDAELNNRIFSCGYKMKYCPSIYVYHHRVANLSELHSKMREYGQGMAKIQIKNGKIIRWHSLTPILLVLLLSIASAAFLYSSIIFVYTCLLLILSILFVSYVVYRDTQSKLAILSPLILLLQYTSYSIGIIEGSIKYR